MGSRAAGWAGVKEVGGESVVMCLVDGLKVIGMEMKVATRVRLHVCKK